MRKIAYFKIYTIAAIYLNLFLIKDYYLVNITKLILPTPRTTYQILTYCKMILLISFLAVIFVYFLLHLLMKMQKFVYEGKLEGDILVLRRTDCEKTTFVQKTCRK